MLAHRNAPRSIVSNAQVTGIGPVLRVAARAG